MLKHQRSNLRRILEEKQGLTSADAKLLIEDVEKAEEALIALYASLIKDGEKDDNGEINYLLVEDKIAETASKAIDECYIANYDWLRPVANNTFGGEGQAGEIDDECCMIIEYAYNARLWLEVSEHCIVDLDSLFGVDADTE